jgi:hypothetical protein
VRHGVSLVSAVVVALLLGTAPAARAQEMPFSTTFKFEINGTVFDAGQYVLRLKNDMLDITPAKGDTTELSILSRIAGPGGSAPGARIVFDKADGTYSLSEIWFPGQDGYLMRYTVEKHTHVFVVPGKSGAR